MSEDTTDYARPPIRPHTRDRLRAAKSGSESFDDVVNRIMDEAGVPEYHGQSVEPGGRANG